MHKFDVKYTYDNYYEYYKFVLIRQRIIKDCLFFALFVGVGLYWLIDRGETTEGTLLPILSFVFAVGMPLMNLITIPMIKKQLHQKQAEIDRTHIVVTFDDEEITYENLSIDPNAEEQKVEEVKEEASQENQEEQVNTDPEKVFTLKYTNFMSVKESKGLFMFYLDRQTVIILPKETYVGETSLEEFKAFILTKIDPRRVKFSK